MLTLLATLLLAIVALLAIPATLTFQVSWPQVAHNDIRLRWAFGLVRARIAPGATKVPTRKRGKPAHEHRRPRKTARNKRNVLAAMRQNRFRRRIWRFVGDLWNAVHKKDVWLRLRIGLADPADTGQLWALVGPVAGILANVRDASIVIEPEFLDSTLELDSAGSLRLIPLQLIWLAVALLLSPAVWRALRQMRTPER